MNDDTHDELDPRNTVNDNVHMSMPDDRDEKIPRFVVLIVIIVFVGLATVLGVAWEISVVQKDAQERACERSVAIREDARSMWLYALDLSEPETREEQRRRALFTAELDRRLPSLECRDGIALPIEP